MNRDVDSNDLLPFLRAINSFENSSHGCHKIISVWIDSLRYVLVFENGLIACYANDYIDNVWVSNQDSLNLIFQRMINIRSEGSLMTMSSRIKIS
jgi:hypothetical protein